MNFQGNSLSLGTSACFSSTFNVRTSLSASQLDFPSSLFREVGQLVMEIENKERKHKDVLVITDLILDNIC